MASTKRMAFCHILLITSLVPTEWLFPAFAQTPETAPLVPTERSVLQPIPAVTSSPSPAPEVLSPNQPIETVAEDELPPLVVTPAPTVPDVQVEQVETKSSASFGDLSIPPYQRHKPQWAIELTASFRPFGGKDWIAGVNGIGSQSRSLELQVEFQPRFFQNFGIGTLSLGPSASLFPVLTSVGVTQNIFSVWEVGGQIRYQLRYFREQPLVPAVSYHFEYISYQLINLSGGSPTVKGSFLASGPTFGLWFLMNILESSAASELYNSLGISRTYLLAEIKFLSGSDSLVSVSGNSFFFGLRFEF